MWEEENANYVALDDDEEILLMAYEGANKDIKSEKKYGFLIQDVTTICVVKRSGSPTLIKV